MTIREARQVAAVINDEALVDVAVSRLARELNRAFPAFLWSADLDNAGPRPTMRWHVGVEPRRQRARKARTSSPVAADHDGPV